MTITELDAVARSALAALLPDTPENVISRHLLQVGACQVWSLLDCVMLESTQDAPGEPQLIGSDPGSVLGLLRSRPGWRAATVDPRIADAVATGLASDGDPVRQVEDRYFTLRERPAIPAIPEARLLRSADADALARVRSAFAEIDPSLDVAWTIGAASFDGAEIVSLAAVTAQTAKFANISAATLPTWRGRGHATAATAVVAAAVIAVKRQALWICSETNAPALAIATELGFAQAATRICLAREGAPL